MIRVLVSTLLATVTLALITCNSKGPISVRLNNDNHGLGSNIDLSAIPQFVNASFNGTDMAWLVTYEEELLLTQDGGATWKTLPKNTIGGFKVVSFINAQRGWAVNKNGQLWRTDDGGNNWIIITEPVSNNERLYLPSQLLFFDENHGWIIDAGSIWRTENGGVSWERVLSITDANQTVWQPFHITFINPMQGWVSCSDGMIHRTEDGGYTWHTQKIESNRTTFKDVQFINQHIGWISGWPDGGIYHSDDGGNTWKRQLSGEININSIYFTTTEEGWAVGWTREVRCGISQCGIVLHSADGGKNWHPIQIGEVEPFFDRIYFTDAQHGWLVARDNVYRTDNGGQSWRVVLRLPPIKTSG